MLTFAAFNQSHNAPTSAQALQPNISSEYPEGTVIRVRKKDGVRMWYFKGVLHRDPEKGPAIENPDGTGECYTEGKRYGEVWADEIVVLPPEPLPAIVAKPVDLPKIQERSRMSFTEFKLQQQRNRAAEASADVFDDESPTLADLSRLFKGFLRPTKSRHRR